MSSQEVEGFAREVRRRGATLESLQAAVPPEQPQLSSTSRKVTWKPSSSLWTRCYSMGTMLLCVICFEGQHLRDEILYTIVHYIFSVHSVEMDEQDETHYNWTLLHHCALRGNDRLANILIGRGADVNVQDRVDRRTPLHEAVRWNKINVVKVMLSHDSDGVTLDTTLRDGGGRTALDLARERNHEGCVQLLVDHESAKETKQLQAGDTAVLPSISELEAAEQEAARLGGTTVIHFLHVAILGAARVGKTSLLKALLEKMHNENELSTPGMRTSYTTTNISDDCRFIECPDMPDALSRLYVITMMCKPSTSNHPQDKETTQDDRERATAGEDPVAGTHAGPMEDSSSSSSSSSDKPAMREEIHKTITGFLNADRVKYISDRANTPDYTVITFRDLGGQQVYQSVQPLFMAKNTTFVATYNSSLDLLETLPKLDEFQVSREECIERATLPANATRLDQLLGWLDMLLLNTKADSSTDQSAADDVFVVGCQSDRWNKTDLPDPCKLLQEKIKGTPYQNLVWNETSHFKIDNTRSTGSAAQADELQRLREAIVDRCQKSQRNIPVPWLRFCISIHTLKQEVSWPWISFKEAKFIAKQVKAVPHDYSDRQVQLLLKYCHEAGHLAYFPTFKLKDTVILEPQFILDCVNAFVYMKPERYITKNEVQRYRSGFMTESLARKALNKMFEGQSYCDHAKAWQAVRASSDGFKLIFEILEWLSVLVIVQDERSAEHEFIVPAVVQDMGTVPQTPCSCVFVSLKHTNCDELMRFPVFLYWQCVVEVLLKSHKRSSATLSRCSVRLRWNRDWPWLHLHYTRYGLQVYVECKGRHGGSGKSTLDEVRAIVLTVVRKWGLQVEVISTLPCPCGETSGEECLQHGLSTCRAPSCAHALDASTLVAEDYPLCTRSNPDIQMIREQAMFWLGLDQDACGKLFDPRSASLPSENPSSGNPHLPASEGTLCPVASQPVATSAVADSVAASQPVATSAVTGSVAASQPVATSAASGSVAASQPEATSAAAGSVAASQPVATSAASGSVVASLIASPAVALLVASLLAAAAASVASVASPIAAALVAAAAVLAAVALSAAASPVAPSSAAATTAEACASVDSRSGGHGARGSGHHSAGGSGVHDAEFMSLGAIGGKTLDQIADWHAFVSSIEPFIGGEEEGDERANCGKAAVQLVAPDLTNYYPNVLKSFHKMNKGNIRGPGKGENNLFCILLYLMQRPSTTVQELFNLLANNAKHSRRRLFRAIKNAKYLKQ
ncbi:uncharacterized protein LOC135818042 [Sycon ciliatum]|uniref:uncharacterized protein LOC135818042 n=1 Tax=Sycon ciliatum TaxID=27933 RepID=UPI0031F6349D